MSTPAMLAIVLYVGPRLGVAEMSNQRNQRFVEEENGHAKARPYTFHHTMMKKSLTPGRGHEGNVLAMWVI